MMGTKALVVAPLPGWQQPRNRKTPGAEFETRLGGSHHTGGGVEPYLPALPAAWDKQTSI